MGVFDKLFGKKKKVEPAAPDIDRMPPMEQFVYRFTQNGGRFLLAQTAEQLAAYLRAILAEEEVAYYYVSRPGLQKMAVDNDIPMRIAFPGKPSEAALLSDVMYLIRNTGGLMISSLQTGGKPLKDLPQVLVFVARAAQLRPDMHEAMASVNKDFHGQYPSQIRTLTRFNDAQDQSSAKTCYLILYEESGTDKA